MRINQPLMVIIWVIPKERAVFAAPAGHEQHMLDKNTHHLNLSLISAKFFLRSSTCATVSPGLAMSDNGEPVKRAITAARLSPGRACRLISSSVSFLFAFGGFFRPNLN